jgi:hypothetical protein
MWIADDETDEPTVELLDGHVVLRAVFDLVRTLRAQGYTIAIVADEVRTTPKVHENAWHVLDANWADVEAVLAELDTTEPQDTRIVLAARETVH